MRKILIQFFIVMILITSLASAANFIYSNSSKIEKDYLDGDVVSGILNMSFANQDNAEFTSNFKGRPVKLLDLLIGRMNYTAGIDFTCNPLNCVSLYIPQFSGEEIKQIRLDEDPQIFGIKIENNRIVQQIDKLEFKVPVNAGEDCSNQIAIDLFNDGNIDIYNTVSSSGDGNCEPVFGRNVGCFDEEDVEIDPIPIESGLYCELMKDIPPSAGYVVGANVIVNQPGGSLGFVMLPSNGGCTELSNGETKALAEKNGISESGQANAIINYTSLEKFDALVCVYTSPNNHGKFSILAEDVGSCGAYQEGCGLFDENSSNVDYDLYLIPKGFGAIGEINVTEETYEKLTGRSLKQDLNDYINSTYNLNCSGSNGCIFPFSLSGIGADDQAIYNAELKYKTSIGSASEKKIFELEEKPAKISSNFLKIYLDRMSFMVPSSTGTQTFKLYLGNRLVTQESIKVDVGFYFDLAPRFAYVGREAAFTTKLNGSVISTIWDFGDGSEQIKVSGDSATHVYSQSGSYQLKVTVMKPATGGAAAKNSTRRFKVIVGEAKTAANLTIVDYEARIVNLQKSINQLPEWTRETATQAIGIDTLKSIVQTEKEKYNQITASSDDAPYISILNDLAAIDIPVSVYSKSSGSLPGDVGLGNINVDILAEATGTTVGDSDELKSNVVDWMIRNYDLTISFENFVIEGEESEAALFNTYKLSWSKKGGTSSDQAYLIIGYPKEGIVFKGAGNDLKGTSLSRGTYLDLTTNALSNMEFLIADSSAPNVANLGAYISTSPSKFGISDKPIKKCWIPRTCDENGNINWTKFTIGIGLLILVFFAVYILLQTWYKNRYEKYLFKNPTDLYNVLNFIYNSRKNGLKDLEIRQNLAAKNWSGEQITYSFRKLEGKRTGMWEIPIFKFAENRKVRDELKKKQGGASLDTRFIKYGNL